MGNLARTDAMALNDPFEESGLGDVLIVDPLTFSRKLMTSLVQEVGCECAVAVGTVADALAALVSAPVDLVIVDRRIGKPALACLLRALRSATEPRFRQMTVLVSADTIDRAGVRALGRLGADGVIITPCSARVLADRIAVAGSSRHDPFDAPRRECFAFGMIPQMDENSSARLHPLPAR